MGKIVWRNFAGDQAFRPRRNGLAREKVIVRPGKIETSRAKTIVTDSKGIG